MIAVRCISCQMVFVTEARTPHTRIKCPGCGDVHELGALTSSTAGESMIISQVALKQMLKSPSGPESTSSHQRPEPVILCPGCKVRLYISLKKYGGKRVSCPECGRAIDVPKATGKRAVAEEPEAPENPAEN